MFPFRTETLLSVGIMAVLLTFLFGPLEFVMFSPVMLAPRFLGGLLVVMLFVQAYFWHFLFQVLRTAAYNEPDLPLSADWDVENMVFDLRTAMGCAAVSFLPLAGFAVMRYWHVLSDHPFLAAAGVVLGILCLPLALLKAMTLLPMLIPLMQELVPHAGGTAAVLMLACCVYWPMALLASVLHETLRASLPWHVIPAMVRVPWAYAQTLLMIVLPVLGAFLTWFVLLSGLTAIMHRLGAMYHTKRHTLGWFPDAPRMV
jgi:hypothetical protein